MKKKMLGSAKRTRHAEVSKTSSIFVVSEDTMKAILEIQPGEEIVLNDGTCLFQSEK